MLDAHARRAPLEERPDCPLFYPSYEVMSPNWVHNLSGPIIQSKL